MQALSKSDDNVRLKLIAIADLVKNIAQLLITLKKVPKKVTDIFHLF